jgi:hypothetical protein
MRKNTLITAIKNLKNLWGSACFLADDAGLAKVQRYRQDLEALFAAFGKPVPESGIGNFVFHWRYKVLMQCPGAGARLSKLSREQLRNLASEKDINSMWATYEEMFLSDTQIDKDCLMKLDDEMDALPMNDAFEDDMGIPGDIKALSLSDLQIALGCNNEGTFPGFNSHRNLDGRDPWENVDILELGLAETLLRLRWHQLVGIMVLIRLLTSAVKPILPQQGVLIADEVGLGKSAQYMGFLSALLHTVKTDETQTPRPPALGELPIPT